MDTQSLASFSSSDFSSSSFSNPSRRRGGRRGRSQGNLLHQIVGPCANSLASGFHISSSPSPSSPLGDYSTFSASCLSSSPSPLVDASDEPNLVNGNANMLSLSPLRSHNPSFSRGRGRGRVRSRRRAPRTTTTTTTTSTSTSTTAAAAAFPTLSRPPTTATTTRPREMAEQPSSQSLPWWKHWETVAINLANLPVEADTFTLWKAFSKEGSIFSIDIFTDIHGNRDTKGKIRFK